MTHLRYACWLLLLSCVPATAQPLEPGDFARGVRLQVAQDRPLQAVVLPRATYETVTRPDLGDLRVFNASGEEVPHALARDDRAGPTAPEPYTLPFFPLRGRPDEGLDRLSIRLRPTASGALMQIEPSPSRDGNTAVRAYIVDASGTEAPIHQLTLHWADTTAGFITTVRTDVSDDLVHWSPWGAPTTLASLRHGAHVLRRNEIHLPPRRVRYLRISWPAHDALPPVARVLAGLALHEEPEREWARLDASAAGPQQYRFEQQGLLPVDRVRFDLPASNVLARASLASAPEPDGPWKEHFDGLVYHLRVDGHDVSTPPIAVPRTTDRYWRLAAHPAGGGFGSAAPALELGWTPDLLLFVPRGAPPYTLAFGRAGTTPSGFDAADLLRLLPRGRDDLGYAGLDGPIVELGGDAQLHEEAELPWSRIALWSTLVLGVVLLVAMSIRLLRQVDRDDRSAPADERAGDTEAESAV